MNTIKVTTRDSKTTVTLARPPLNILTIEMMTELSETLRDCERSSKVILIKGEGRCFSAGADVKEHLPEQVDRMLDVFHTCILTLLSVQIPTISAVHGMALGGGLELALITDLTYASDDAKLGQPEIALGVIAPFACVYLPSQIGIKKTCELLYTGKTITGREATELGMINACFPEKDLFTHVDQIADQIAKLSRPALVACKRSIQKSQLLALERSILLAKNIYLNELMKAEDPVEGLKSFLEKRQPIWKDK